MSKETFFTRYLETEAPPELRVNSDVKAGAGGGGGGSTQYPDTKKYPSDGEDSGNSGFADYDW
jgi:Serine endopeptidase inhibitors